MLYTAAPSTWPTGSKPTLRIAANSSAVSAEPQVPLRRISAILASATAGSSSLTPLAYIFPRLVLRVPFLISPLDRFQCVGGRFTGGIGTEPVLTRGGTVVVLYGVVLEAVPPSLSLFSVHSTLDSQSMATVLHPGRLSPARQVPAEITRPEYVGKKRPRTGEPDVKTPEIIEQMRVAGKLAAQALAAVGEAVAPGVTTDHLDQVGHDFLVSHGAYPSTLGYRGYPKSLCTSLNEVICHGIPDDTVINDGDIVNVDITAYIGGVHGDTNATFLAGEVDEESRLLVERTHEAMMRGIRAVAPGRPLNAVGRVIESYARRFGYGVVRDFTGHGIGTTFHSGLIVPHFDDPAVNLVMEEGMTFTIEPMLTLGTIAYDVWDDGWTAVTKDHKRTAQFEHTVLVTGNGYEILTLP